MPLADNFLAKNERPQMPESVLRYLASETGSLFYEVTMLTVAENKVSQTPPSNERNLAIECFLLHFRNLRDFLYPPSEPWTGKKAEDNVIAFDFCPQWKQLREDWAECSPNETDRLNKLLAHLTYSRP